MPKCKSALTTELTDNGNVATGDMGCTGKTSVTGIGCEQENSGVADGQTTLAANQATELHVGVSFEEAIDGEVFEFALYEGGVQIGVGAGSVTLGAPPTGKPRIANTLMGQRGVKM